MEPGKQLFAELLAILQPLTVHSTILIFILAIVPGFIIVFVRSQFVSGRILPYPAGFLVYLSVSTVYWLLLFFLFVPVIGYLLDILIMWGLWRADLFSYTTKSLLWIVFLPILVGVISGWISNNVIVYKLLTKIRLKPIHPTPSAWDWTFSDFDEQFVLVRLKNGTILGGLMGSNSFVSSDPEERDIYIQEIYEVDNENKWSAQGHGVFISGGEISTIEFLPLEINKEDENEQDS